MLTLSWKMGKPFVIADVEITFSRGSDGVKIDVKGPEGTIVERKGGQIHVTTPPAEFNDLDGWARYIKAKIRVIDTLKAQEADLESI